MKRELALSLVLSTVLSANPLPYSVSDAAKDAFEAKPVDSLTRVYSETIEGIRYQRFVLLVRDVRLDVLSQQGPRSDEHASLLASALSGVPVAVLRSLPGVAVFVALDSSDYQGATAKVQSRSGFTGTVFRIMVSMRAFSGDDAEKLEEVLIHEIAHVFDHNCPLSDHWTWEDAVVDDGNALISEYAGLNVREDFAENFLTWLAWSRRSLPDSVEFQPNRFWWFSWHSIEAAASGSGILFETPCNPDND